MKKNTKKLYDFENFLTGLNPREIKPFELISCFPFYDAMDNSFEFFNHSMYFKSIINVLDCIYTLSFRFDYDKKIIVIDLSTSTHFVFNFKYPMGLNQPHLIVKHYTDQIQYWLYSNEITCD